MQQRNAKPTVNDCYKLGIKTLREYGLFDKGVLYMLASIDLAVALTFDREAGSIQLRYRYGGADHCYNVRVHRERANIGGGYRLYLVCPVSGAKCNTLYMGTDGGIFKSRNAFETPLLYPLQACSRAQRISTRLSGINARIEQITGNRIAPTHRGNITRRYQKQINLMGMQQDHRVRLLGQCLKVLNI